MEKVIFDKEYIEKIVSKLMELEAYLLKNGEEVASIYTAVLRDDIKEKMAAGDPATECPHCGFLRK